MFLSEFSVTSKQLEGLRQYKYSSSTDSLIDNTFLLPAFWDAIQRRLPRWLSPNAITLAGFFGNVFGFVPLVLYSWGLEAARPYSLLLTAVCCGFFYNTCDNLDGKHARALGVGSVVGELFDHGLDSMANIFQLFPVVMALEMIKIDFYLVIQETTISGRDSGPSTTEGDLIVVEPETESNVIVSISIEQSNSLPSASDHDSHSSFADVEDLRLVLFLLTDTYSLLFFSRKLAVGRIQFQMVDTTEIQYTSFLGIIVTLLLGYSFWDIAITIPGTSLTLPTFRFIFGVLGSFPLLSNSVIQIYEQIKSPKRANVYYVFIHCAIIWFYSFAMFELIPSAKANCMPYFILLGGCFSKLITETVFVSTGTIPERSMTRTEMIAPIMLLVNSYSGWLEPNTAACCGAFLTVSLWVLYFSFVVYKSARFLNLPVLTVPSAKQK